MNTTHTTIPGHTITVKPRQGRYMWTCECGARADKAFPQHQHAVTGGFIHVDTLD